MSCKTSVIHRLLQLTLSAGRHIFSNAQNELWHVDLSSLLVRLYHTTCYKTEETTKIRESAQRLKTYIKARHTSVSYQSVNMLLNLFDIPGIDYRFGAKRWIPFKPANTGRHPILFTAPSSDDYYDLNETKLEVKVRMNTAGANGLLADETGALDGNNTKYVYCVNNFGHTLFNQMNVSFNGVFMTEQGNAYHQKAYLATLQNYNRQEGDTTLAAQGWVNELNVCDSLTPTNANNDDKPNPNNWSGKTGLKALTSRSLGKAYHDNSMAKTG